MKFSELTVVVPTRNNHPDIVAHLGSLEALVSLGVELVFVDSESTDGTVDAVNAFRNLHGGTMLALPPGLYASWNSGVEAANRKWIVFATIGDTQSVGGLQHLLEVAEKNRADVVVSPPRMRVGPIESPHRWPIHQLASNISEARILDRMECLRWLVGFLPGTMLGSAASNIYRKGFLLSNPFPINFDHEGDVAWGIEIAQLVRLAVTPRPCADFQVHPRQSTLDAQKQRQRFAQLVDLARNRLEKFPEFLAEMDIAWSRQIELWDWICRLESVADVSREQKFYINQLEEERSALRELVLCLEKLPVLPLTPFLKRGLLSPLFRRMRLKTSKNRANAIAER